MGGYPLGCEPNPGSSVHLIFLNITHDSHASVFHGSRISMFHSEIPPCETQKNTGPLLLCVCLFFFPITPICLLWVTGSFRFFCCLQTHISLASQCQVALLFWNFCSFETGSPVTRADLELRANGAKTWSGPTGIYLMALAPGLYSLYVIPLSLLRHANTNTHMGMCTHIHK